VTKVTKIAHPPPIKRYGVAKAMLLNSISETPNQQEIQPKAAAGKNTASPAPAEEEKAFSKSADGVRIPASEATLEAAAKAKGMKKIELEIAAAAGLLRPISPEPPPEAIKYSGSLEDLLQTIEDLENPPKSPNFDLFE
jgi:hypothetical protein